MARVSILQQLYQNQEQSIVEQPVNKTKWWNGKYRFYFIWMLIGILVGGIPLVIFVIMYVQPQSTSTTVFTTAVVNSTSSSMLRWDPVGITIAGVTSMSGNASNKLNTPYDVVVDRFNTIYIVDRFNNRVQKYLMGASSGSTVAGQADGSAGNDSSHLRSPYGATINSNGDVFVVDRANQRIQFWANGALSGTTVAGSTSGVSGNSVGLLDNPCGVALDSNTGTLYIADNLNHRVMSYASGASSGTLVAGGNGPGISSNQLSEPFTAYFDSASNSLAISNSDTNTVVRWVLGASSWTILAGDISGAAGSTPTLLDGPRGITFDSMGNMYVADMNNHRIQLFMAGQTTGRTIAGITGVTGNNASLLNRPYSIKLDNDLNLYVADTYNHRIQKFLRY